jgi:magnesium-transporting ATPase (P-type)
LRASPQLRRSWARAGHGDCTLQHIALASGSDIAIEAADIVLLKSFSVVVEAVQYGYVVFDNLKKTIVSSSLPEALLSSGL